MIKEIELTNEDNFIKCFDHLYQDITSEYNLGDTMEKINVQREAKRIDNLFSCCFNTDFVYSKYTLLENAIYELLYVNHIEISKTKDTNIEFILAKSHNETIVENSFGIHQDTGSKVKGNSYTMIIYLHTDCQEGELIFYEKRPSGDFEKTITVDPNTRLSSTTKVVIFDGEIFHKPEPFYNGQRCAIVCQVSK
jgi:hypothetical protein